MAIYNEILAGRFNRSLQKIFAIKGSPPVRQIGGEIVPVHLLRSGVEHDYLEGWNRYASVLSVVGAAGNSATIRLTNDIGTNVIAVIEKLLVWATIATIAPINFTNFQTLVSGHVPVLTGAVGGNALDFRISPNSNQFGSTLQMSSSANTNGAGSALAQMNLAANVEQDFILFEDQELTMGPQSLLQIASNTAANTLAMSVIWRERLLEESERS